MLVRDKNNGEEFSIALELELVPGFSIPGPGWELSEDGRSAKNPQTGEERKAPPNAQWCLHVPELEETEVMPTKDLSRRHTGNWDHVPPGDDTRYEFVPENDEERRTLTEYGFTPKSTPN